MGKRPPLPDPFFSYLRSRKSNWKPSTYSSTQGHLRHFSNFLATENVSLEKLAASDLISFAEYLKKQLKTTPSSRLTTRKSIQTCLVWLCKTEVLDRDYRDWYPNYKHWPHLKGSLPTIAQDYLDLMITVTKATSRARFRSDLIRFHQFLKDRRMTLRDVRRSHIENFLKLMHKRGLSPATKARAVITLRKYCYWLAERDQLGEDPEKLFRPKDVPPIPDRLPRPFAPAIDAAVQSKLKQGQDIFYDALLLMRHTGLRVGELKGLEFHCLREDGKGNFFLKVPLGKLNTERLVPLTSDLVDLVKKIQRQSQKHSRTSDPRNLVIASTGRPALFYDFRARMDEIQTSLPSGTTAQSHQLRHSCATTLLNHGMNLVALKELLGHKDIRMTLNYAKVAPENIRREYEAAVEKMRAQVKTDPIGTPREIQTESIETLISDLILIIQKNSELKDNKTQNMIRTLRRLLADFERKS